MRRISKRSTTARSARSICAAPNGNRKTHCTQNGPNDAEGAWNGTSTSAPGFWDRHQLAERYAEVSGRDISQLDFYVAFAFWKLACIIEGVYSRYLGGALGDRPPEERAPFKLQVEQAAATAERYVVFLALPASIDRAIGECGLQEIIVVIPNAMSPYGGSMYALGTLVNGRKIRFFDLTEIARSLTALASPERSPVSVRV